MRADGVPRRHPAKHKIKASSGYYRPPRYCHRTNGRLPACVGGASYEYIAKGIEFTITAGVLAWRG